MSFYQIKLAESLESSNPLFSVRHIVLSIGYVSTQFLICEKHFEGFKI